MPDTHHSKVLIVGSGAAAAALNGELDKGLYKRFRKSTTPPRTGFTTT